MSGGTALAQPRRLHAPPLSVRLTMLCFGRTTVRVLRAAVPGGPSRARAEAAARPPHHTVGDACALYCALPTLPTQACAARRARRRTGASCRPRHPRLRRLVPRSEVRDHEWHLDTAELTQQRKLVARRLVGDVRARRDVLEPRRRFEPKREGRECVEDPRRVGRPRVALDEGGDGARVVDPV